MGKPAGQEQQTLSLRLPVIPLSASSVSHIYKRRKAPGRNVPGPFVCTLPTGWACNWPEPTSRNRCTAFCAAVSFFAGFRARYVFHNFFTFCSFGGSATAPSQAVTAASQHRFKSVSNSPSQSTIFSHFVVFLCYLSGLYLCFLGILSIFGIFSSTLPLVDRAQKV